MENDHWDFTILRYIFLFFSAALLSILVISGFIAILSTPNAKAKSFFLTETTGYGITDLVETERSRNEKVSSSYSGTDR